MEDQCWTSKLRVVRRFWCSKQVKLDVWLMIDVWLMGNVAGAAVTAAHGESGLQRTRRCPSQWVTRTSVRGRHMWCSPQTPDPTPSLICAITNLILAQTMFFTRLATAYLLSSLSNYPRPPSLTGCQACRWTPAEPRPATTSYWSEVSQELPARSDYYAHPSFLGGYQSNGYANSYPAASHYNDHLGHETSVTYQHNPYTSDFWSPTPEHEPSSTPPFFANLAQRIRCQRQSCTTTRRLCKRTSR